MKKEKGEFYSYGDSPHMSKIRKALYKRAVGYTAEDRVEEYIVDESGGERLSKYKITTYEVQPDMSALKMLLEQNKDEVELTAEEMEKEKVRLLKELSKLSGGNFL